jgi:hypothetical protein
MEKLEKVAIDHIDNQTALKSFLKYCKVHCGWFAYSQVNSEDVETCLVNFKKDHPEQAKYVS